MMRAMASRWNRRRGDSHISLGVQQVLQNDGCTWSGWMRRKGKIHRALGNVTSKVLNIPWRQSFVVLLNGIMHLYANEIARRPRKSLDLSQFNGVIRAYDLEEEDSPWCFHMIPLAPKDKPQLFCCSSEAELKDCMGHIRQEILNAHRRPSESTKDYNEVDYFVLEKPILGDDYIDIIEDEEELYTRVAECGIIPLTSDTCDEEQDADDSFSDTNSVTDHRQDSLYANISFDGDSHSRSLSAYSSGPPSRAGSGTSNQSNAASNLHRFDVNALRTSSTSTSSASTSDGFATWNECSSSHTEYNHESIPEGQLQEQYDRRTPSPRSMSDVSSTLTLEDVEISAPSVTASQSSSYIQSQQQDISGPSQRCPNVVFTSIHHFIDTSDKTETSRMLTESSIEGAYLVRNSRNSSDQVLSVYTNGVKEYRLHQTTDNKWFLIKGAVFRSLEELLTFYSDNPLPNRDVNLRPDIATLC